jgi:hypothetical protein
MDEWVFMQDGAACHTSAPTMEKLRRRVHMLPDWPLNSPDSNPIETA